MSHRFIASCDLFRDDLLVDGEGKGTPHPPIVEGRPADVEAIKICGEQGAGMKIRSSAEFGEDQRRDHSFVEQDIGLTGGVEVECRACAVDGKSINPIDLDALRGVIKGVLFEGNTVINFPIQQPVWTVPDPVFRPDPSVFEFFNRTMMNGEVGGKGGQGGKKRSRVFEMDHQGAFIRRFDSHRIRGTFARVVGFRATDKIEDFRIRGGSCGMKGP